MIKLLKRLPALSMNFTLKNLFSSSQKDNFEFHKAVLASKIIKTIRQSPLNEYRSKSFQSLSEEIKAIIDNYEKENEATFKKSESIKTAAQQVRNCFTSGVYVPEYMCRQDRFKQQLLKTSGLNSDAQIEILHAEEADKEKLNELEFRKLTFIPTYIVTGQMFRNIFYERDEYQLITGQFGVGKTYSFVLYTLLSQMIFRYRHKYWKTAKKNELPCQIDFNLPKAIYQSYDLFLQKYQNPEKRLRQRLILIYRFQCYELKDLWENCDIFNMKKSIKQQYWKRFDIKTVKVCDQINIPISIYQKQNQLRHQLQQSYQILSELYGDKQYQKYFKMPNKQEEGQKQKKDEQIILMKLRHQKFLEELKIAKANYRNIFDKVQNHLQSQQLYKKYFFYLKRTANTANFSRILYVSSVDIDKNLLKQINLTATTKQKTLIDFPRPLQYPNTLFSNIAVADATEMIMMKLKEYWKENMKKSDSSQQFSQEQLSQLSRIQNITIQELRLNKYYLILPVIVQRFFIKTLKSLENFDISPEVLKFQNVSSLNSMTLGQKINQILKNVENLSIQKAEKQLVEFFNKQQQNKELNELKSSLIFKLYIYSLDHLKNQEQKYFKAQDQPQNYEKAKKFRAQMRVQLFHYKIRKRYIKKQFVQIHQLKGY